MHKAGYQPAEIFHLLKHDGYNRNFISRTIKRYTENGKIEDRKRTGRVRSVRTKKFIEAVRQRIRRKSQRSARKMATQMKCSATSMRRVLKEDLKTRPYKKRRANYLTAKQKQNRVKKCKELLQLYDDFHVENMLFTDEKIFTIEEEYNSQNIRIYFKYFAELNDNEKFAFHQLHLEY